MKRERCGNCGSDWVHPFTGLRCDECGKTSNPPRPRVVWRDGKAECEGWELHVGPVMDDSGFRWSAYSGPYMAESSTLRTHPTIRAARRAAVRFARMYPRRSHA